MQQPSISSFRELAGGAYIPMPFVGMYAVTAFDQQRQPPRRERGHRITISPTGCAGIHT
jgi:hypothetical protein